jgi:hypothetical protein
MDNLLDTHPKDVLVHHGPTKLLVDKYHWYSHKVGLVASYNPTAFDVNDHFGIFRGVDQIEAFAQATSGTCSVLLECEKLGVDPHELGKILNPSFISVGQVTFHDYVEQGETIVSIGHIKFYKFRQIVCDGKIYKAPKGLNLDEYFSNYTNEKLLTYDLSPDFTLVADMADITGRAFRKETFEKQLSK